MKSLDKFSPYALSLLRILVGYMLFLHGLDKTFDLFGGQVALESIYGVGGIIELVTGFLVMIGFFTRPAAFLASGQMAYAYFVIHGELTSSGATADILFPILNQGELALTFSLVFFVFIFVGAGPLALGNHIFFRK